MEKLEVKRRLFAELDAIAPAHAILATNSSSIVSSRIAGATGRPDRVCNLHFFNPALVMACVEVARGPETSDETVGTSVELARRLGKTPVVLEREIPGFIANRILNAVRDEAVFLLENGIASVADIDTACRTALGHPMGPFELMDLTGIDIGFLTKQDRFAETGDPGDRPSRSVAALVERGELGPEDRPRVVRLRRGRQQVPATDGRGASGLTADARASVDRGPFDHAQLLISTPSSREASIVAPPSTTLRRMMRVGGSPVSHEANHPVTTSAINTARKVSTIRSPTGRMSMPASGSAAPPA